MISAVRSSVSALAASSSSLAARADNIANVRTSAREEVLADEHAMRRDAADDVFRPVRPTYVARDGGGVDVRFDRTDPSHRVAFDPGDTRADKDGRVALPNVNLGEEIVGVIRDGALFKANLAVFEVADEMAGQLLDEEV